MRPSLPAQNGHEHKWQANGLVRERREQRSPVSQWDDWLYTAVLSVMTCECGAVKKVLVGREDSRSRGDDLRAGRC